MYVVIFISMIKLKQILNEQTAADDTILKISDAIISEVANSKSRFEAIFTANKMPYEKADGDENYDDPNYCYQKNTIAMLTALDTYATDIKKLHKQYLDDKDYSDVNVIVFNAHDILSIDMKSNIEGN